MKYPNLYIKSLLEEVKSQNNKMLELNNDLNKKIFMNYHPEEYNKIQYDIESLSLYIEQLHQEVVETFKNIKD